jgi:type VI secretion system protein ImpK
MDTPRWALDANLLGLAFRAAWLEFRAVLAAQAGPAQDLIGTGLAEAAAVRMDAALNDICLTLTRHPGLRMPVGADDQAEALQFAFAQVVDETLLNEPWPGRSVWDDHLLEWRMFKTRSGGASLIDRIDAITRTSDRASREIAELYLYCLTLGYAGRFRDQPQGRAELARRRAMLFAFLYPEMPGIDDPAFTLSEASDDGPLRIEPARRSLAQRARVVLIGAALLAVPLIVSVIMWLTLRPIVGNVTRAITEKT